MYIRLPTLYIFCDSHSFFIRIKFLFFAFELFQKCKFKYFEDGKKDNDC